MKGCLKLSPTPSPGLECAQTRKCVAFGADGSETVYMADEWDRTPTEPARKLSYQDLLELKEIQRSLPRANQLPDPVTGKIPSHYLSAVPIGLLPLLPESNSGESRDTSSNSTPISSPLPSRPLTSTNWTANPHFRQPPKPPTHSISPPKPWHPPHLAHLLPGRPAPQRQKSKFTFLPLLDPPPSSETTSGYPPTPPSRSSSPDPPSDADQSQDPPTPSLTDASVDSSPLSRASSCSPEPPYLQLPPALRRHQSKSFQGQNESYFPNFSDEQPLDLYDYGHPPNYHPTAAAARLKAVPSPCLVPPSPLFLDRNPLATPAMDGRPQNPHDGRAANVEPPRKPRRRNVIVVNDVEIELDDDDDDESSPSPSILSSQPDLSSLSLLEADDRLALGPGISATDFIPCNVSSPATLDSGENANSEPSTSPSQSTPSSSPSQSTGFLHAPIRFKRNPVVRDSQAPISSLTSHYVATSMRQRSSPSSSPILVPSA